jgi:hypothetical protein
MNDKKERSATTGVRAAGWLALLGCLVMLTTSIIAPLLHPDMNFVTHTVSEFAEGRLAWVQDLGICALAVAMAAAGVALYRLHLGGYVWKAGSVLMVLIGVQIGLLALYNEYGDFDSSRVTIHLELVWGIGLGLVAALVSLTKGLARVRRSLAGFTLVVAVLLLLGTPSLPMISTGWDGLYERVICVFVLLWLATVSWMLARWRGGFPDLQTCLSGSGGTNEDFQEVGRGADRLHFPRSSFGAGARRSRDWAATAARFEDLSGRCPTGPGRRDDSESERGLLRGGADSKEKPKDRKVDKKNS